MPKILYSLFVNDFNVELLVCDNQAW